MAVAFDHVSLVDLERLEFVAMGQSDAEEVAAWKYPGFYAFYDSSADPEDEAELLDPSQRDGAFFSARIPDVGLIGFAELKPQLDSAVEIGLGLRPECAGRGWGTGFVRRVCGWASSRVSPSLLVLRVASFNTRAIRVYQRVGFSAVGVEIANSNGGKVEFVRMERGPFTQEPDPVPATI